MRFAARITTILLAGLWLGSLVAWPHLPARMPIHFGINGRADHWVETSLLAWFGLPLLALALVLGNAALVRWLPRRPELFNHPDKQRFLALPAPYRAPVIRRMQEFLHWISVQVVLLFGLIQVAILRTALGATSSTFMVAVLVLAVAVLPMLLLWNVSRVQAEITRQFRRFQQQAQSGSP